LPRTPPPAVPQLGLVDSSARSMKVLAVIFAAVAVLLFAGVWYSLSAVDTSNMLALEATFGRGPSENFTYEGLYRQTLIIARWGMHAERLAYAIPSALLVISGLLFGWARDRSRLHSVTRHGASPTINQRRE